MSEIENGRLGLYGTEHSKCNHLITLGSKGLMCESCMEVNRELDRIKQFPPEAIGYQCKMEVHWSI